MTPGPFHLTGETAAELNMANEMLLNKQTVPLIAAADAITSASIPSNPNITSNPDLPAANDIHFHQSAHQPTQTPPCFNDLIAVLIECFALIAIGYLSGRFKLISSDAKDIGAYLTTFALPMIIFLNIAQMEIQTINLSFLACMLASKLLLFVLVTAITLAISYPANFSFAGALSILATQSNDFALGYPLFKSLYGESKPEMLSYLNLMGPIQLLIINPLGIVMLEFGKLRTQRVQRCRANSILAKRRCVHRLDRYPVCHSNDSAQQISMTNPVDQTSRDDDRGQLARSPPGSRPIRSSVTGGKNIESSPLVMPAKVLLERSVSEESTDDLVECYRRKPGGSQTAPVALCDPDELSSSRDSVNSETGPGERAALSTRSKYPSNSESAGHPGQPQDPAQRLAAPRRQRAQVAVVQHADVDVDAPGTCAHCNAIATATAEDGAHREPVIDLGFVKALLTNPLIIASVVALAVNLIHGPELPKFVTKVSNTIAASFAAPALFVVGLSMYGKFKLIIKNPNDLLLSSVLVLTKVFILPNVMRTIILLVLPHYSETEEIPYLADFAYLYGLLPTAPGACIIAKQYEVLTNVVSICMLLSTFISAPMMLGTSAIISQVSATAPETTLNIIAQTLRISSCITLVLSLLTLYMLWKSNRRLMSTLDRIMRNVAELRATHIFTFLLTLTQLLIGIGGLLWLFVDTSKLRQQSFIDLMARDGSLLATPSDAHWPRDDVDDLLAEEERIQSMPEASAFMIAPNTQAIGFGALCTMKYMLASGGLLIARFIILCIVVTNYAKHCRGHQMAVQVSSLMLRVFPLFAIGVSLSLVFESRHLSCLPSESSLPTWTFSLYLRLTFNAILLLLAVPMFTATFRLSNKAAWSAAQSLQETAPSPAGLLENRRFVTSNVSLSSDTSSAVTTSTNLEATLNGAPGQQAQRAHNAQQASPVSHAHLCPRLLNGLATGSTVVPIDLDGTTINQHEQPERNGHPTKPPAAQAYHLSAYESQSGVRAEDKTPISASEEALRQQHQKKMTITQCDINNNCNEAPKSTRGLRAFDRQDNDSATKGAQGNNDVTSKPGPCSNNTPQESETIPHALASISSVDTHEHWPPVTEFNKYSILVVFMLFQALVSLTSIIQMLSQDKPAGGTFVMSEITNVALDFGQGLVTFLVIGSQSYLKDLISSFNSSSARTGQRSNSQA